MKVLKNTNATPIRRMLWGIHCLIAGGALAGGAWFFTACEEEEGVALATSTGISGMSGSVKANIHDYYVKGETCLLTADGITAPTADKVSYQWDITDAATTSVWGSVIRFGVPEGSTSFTIKVQAKADAHYSTSITKSATVIADNYAETVLGITAGSTFVDNGEGRDGQVYQYAPIGGYDWMTQNLNWAGAGISYKKEKGYDIIFGRLYSWEEATSTTHPICPAGWHLPDSAAWADLGTALNGAAVPFAAEWEQLGSYASANATVNGKTLWPYHPDNRKENTVGWNALPAGKYSISGVSSDNGRYGYWWSATEYNDSEGYYRYIMHNKAIFYYNYGDKDGLYLSVRCVREIL